MQGVLLNVCRACVVGGGGEDRWPETDLLRLLLPQNWELREALGHKSRECEELRQELAKLQAKKPTRIPVPLLHTRSGHSSEGCLCVDQLEVLQDRGEALHGTRGCFGRTMDESTCVL